ncbi:MULTISPECIES: hypothetical protein [Halomonadaceae]|uniref:hypothetical protein n=1 Tax=Halomonadaceae TaxID=28256 RepID=UPI00148258CE|nr:MULTISPECIES: hypothetical protein [Halomonas]MBS3667745.1 hypothetical protein [Halomonas boliviensis]
MLLATKHQVVEGKLELHALLGRMVIGILRAADVSLTATLATVFIRGKAEEEAFSGSK